MVKPYVKRHDDAHNSREVPMQFLFHDGIYIFNVVIYIFNVGIYIFNDVKYRLDAGQCTIATGASDDCIHIPPMSRHRPAVRQQGLNGGRVMRFGQ